MRDMEKVHANSTQNRERGRERELNFQKTFITKDKKHYKVKQLKVKKERERARERERERERERKVEREGEIEEKTVLDIPYQNKG